MDFKVYLKKLRDFDHVKKRKSLLPQLEESETRGGGIEHRRVSIINLNPSVDAISGNGQVPNNISNYRRTSVVQDVPTNSNQNRSQSHSDEIERQRANQFPGRGQNYSYWRAAEALFASNGVPQRRRRSSFVFLVDKPDGIPSSKGSGMPHLSLNEQLPASILVDHVSDHSENPSKFSDENHGSVDAGQGALGSEIQDLEGKDPYLRDEPDDPDAAFRNSKDMEDEERREDNWDSSNGSIVTETPIGCKEPAAKVRKHSPPRRLGADIEKAEKHRTRLAAGCEFLFRLCGDAGCPCGLRLRCVHA